MERMSEESTGSFTTRPRSLADLGELNWGSTDGDTDTDTDTNTESWTDAVDSSTAITVTDNGSVTSETQSAAVVYNFADGTTGNWTYYTDDASDSSWGVKSVTAPDDGDYAIYLTQSSGGGDEAYIYSEPVDYDWAQSYDFEFLIKSDSFNDTGSYLGAQVGWRGVWRDSTHISMRVFNDTDADSFLFQGESVSNTTTHTVDWAENTWYWITGETDEQNGTVQAKIWRVGETEPSSYQISADITTGVSTGEVHARANGYSTLDLTVAHMKFDTSQ